MKDWFRFKQENFILDYLNQSWADFKLINKMDSFSNNMNSILDAPALSKKVNKYKIKF